MNTPLRHSVRLAGLGLLLLILCGTTRADEKSRQIVNGLLRALIESQHGGDPGRGPGPARLAPPSQVPPGVVISSEMQRTRVAIDGIVIQSVELSTHLQSESQKNPALGPLMADVLRVRARAEAVQRRSRVVNDHRVLIEDARQLDQDWRGVTWKLRQTHGLGQSCRTCLDKADEHHGHLCAALSIEPQLDRRGLAQHSQSLRIYLGDLLEDMQIELRQHPQHSQLVLGTSQAQQSVDHFAEDSAHGQPRDHLVQVYQQFKTNWSPTARALRGVPSRFIERHLLRIQQADQQIHDLLWLPRGIDRELLMQLATGLDNEVHHAFGKITLETLLDLPGIRDIPGAADEFHGTVQHFIQCLRDGESPDELIHEYQFLGPAWVNFSRHFRSSNAADVRQCLAEIERRLVALREPLGIHGGISLDEARERAAKIEKLAEHLEGDLTTWLAGDAKHKATQVKLLEQVRVLRSSTRQLHLALIKQSPPESIEALSGATIKGLDQLQGTILSVNAPDRDHVMEILIELSRELVQLEAMFLG